MVVDQPNGTLLRLNASFSGTCYKFLAWIWIITRTCVVYEMRRGLCEVGLWDIFLEYAIEDGEYWTLRLIESKRYLNFLE